MNKEYKTAWISAFSVAEDIEKKELDGYEFVCFTPHSRTSGEGLKGTFLREYEVLLKREKA